MCMYVYVFANNNTLLPLKMVKMSILNGCNRLTTTWLTSQIIYILGVCLFVLRQNNSYYYTTNESKFYLNTVTTPK